ncbi:MAG TPA: hypothetical protein PKA32_03825 [Candidatus Gracilibacteria bacterium]|nr:hypothetical protein [Candidatus Gracilibacteria bacterium]
MAEVNRNIESHEEVVETSNSADTIKSAILSRKNMVAKALAAVLAVSSASCAYDESFDEPSLSKVVDSKETQTQVPKLGISMSANSDLRNYSLDLISAEDLTITIKGVDLNDPTNTFETHITVNIDEKIGKGLSSEMAEFQKPASRFELKAFNENGKEMPINFSGEKGTIKGEAIQDVEKDFGIEVE